VTHADPTKFDQRGTVIDLARAERVSAAELLGRDEHSRVDVHASAAIAGKRVLVTGAAGSIGSELVRQARRLGAERVFIVDHDESRMHALQLEMTGSGLLDGDDLVLADLRDRRRVRNVFAVTTPDVVYHAAAHKHLPLLEQHPCEGVKTNVRATQHVVEAAVDHGAECVTLVSTDKAADPTSVLGATKRLAEDVVRSYAGGRTRVASVRFGNVLGSRGSFLDTITWQLRAGLPVTMTHEDVTRYFMTIPEAVRLVIEASAMAAAGETFVLDMGEPVRIVDIVQRYAAAIGAASPAIVCSGLRRGEKLHEVLWDAAASCEATELEGVSRLLPVPRPSAFDRLELLYEAAARDDARAVRLLLPELVSGFGEQHEVAV
jgi:FlaA1/EpsC-like NDP-sugar epimerase